MQNLPTQENADFKNQPPGSPSEQGDFVPLLTDLPDLDDLLRRHRVPRRGLVHFDVASTLASVSLVQGVCFHAMERGEKVVCIAVDPNQDSSGQEEKNKDANFRFYFARNLSDLNDRLHDLQHEAQPPDLIVVHDVERLFHPNTLQLTEPPFSMDGFARLEELVAPEQRDVLLGQAPQCKMPSTGGNFPVGNEAELRARLSRVALCQWLAALGTVFRTLSSSLWLVPSVGTPSIADSTGKAKLKSVCQNTKAVKDQASQTREADSLSFRSLLDTYCDYSLRWGVLTQRFDRKTGQKTEGYPVSLHSFSLSLGEALVASSDQSNEEGQTGAKEPSGAKDDIEEPRDRGFRA